MNVFVFAGPTIPAEEVRAELPATCLPPVSQGDVYRVALEQPVAIGIIDGYFERVPAVWHKEILWALSRGIHVFGAASMGALRAAELEPFGMIGVGRIFDAYRSGELEDDDDVTVMHGDADSGYLQLSAAMVDLRATLARAGAEGCLLADTCRHLERRMKALHYTERSYPALVEAARSEAPEAADAFERWLETHRVPQKKRDAVAMLRAMRDLLGSGPSPKAVTFHFEHTDVWDQVSRRSGRQLAAARPDALPLEWLLDEVRLDRRVLETVLAGAFARALALDQAERQGVTVELPLFRQTLDGFRRERELLDAGSLSGWMDAQEIGKEEFLALIQHEARVQWMRTLFAPDVDRQLVDTLRLLGRYGALATRGRDKARTLAALGLENPSIDDVPLDLDALLRWFFTEVHGDPVPANLDLHAVNRGYRDRDSLVQAILREYLYRACRERPPEPPSG